MWWKTTPKPLTGFSQSVSPTGNLLVLRPVVVRQVERRHREATRRGLVGQLLELGVHLGLPGLLAPLVDGVEPHPDGQRADDDDRAEPGGDEIGRASCREGVWVAEEEVPV